MSYEKEIRESFPVCPLCGTDNLTIKIQKSFGKDRMSCKNCGAKWHLFIGIFSSDFNAAELEVEADDGTGKELLKRRIKRSQWEKMARQAKRSKKEDSERIKASPSIIKEKETIIKEIVIIPCKYCGALMPQTSTFCPSCSARRKG